jgi:hypothetical protein
VLLTDPLETAALEGTAELWQSDGSDGPWTPFATAPLSNDPVSLLSRYQFDAVPPGNYLLRVSLSDGSPYAADYLPTYFGTVIHWTAAGTVLPSDGTGFDIQLVPAQSLSGPGTIGGSVSEEGFHGGGGPRGNALEDVDIVLYDATETPARHTRTNADGRYSFPDLPYGTYRLDVDIIGKNPAERWVTIGPDLPVSDDNDFQVGEDGVFSDATVTTGELSCRMLPNPATDFLRVMGTSRHGGKTSVRIRHLSGVLSLTQSAVLPADSPWKLDLVVSTLPSGIYILEMTGPDGTFVGRFVKADR